MLENKKAFQPDSFLCGDHTSFSNMTGSVGLIHLFYFSLYMNANSVTGQSWYVTQIDSNISIKLCVSVESDSLVGYICVCGC